MPTGLESGEFFEGGHPRSVTQTWRKPYNSSLLKMPENSWSHCQIWQCEAMTMGLRDEILGMCVCLCFQNKLVCDSACFCMLFTLGGHPGASRKETTYRRSIWSSLCGPDLEVAQTFLLLMHSPGPGQSYGHTYL